MKTNIFSWNFFAKIFRDFFKNFFKIFLIIGIFFIGIASVNANTGMENFSSTGFTVDLSTLDPIQRQVKTDENGDKITTSNGAMGLFTKLMESISNLMLLIIPILAGVSLIIAGYFYIFSFSDGEMQTKAKNIIKYNLMAMGVAFLSYVIINIIAGFFK